MPHKRNPIVVGAHHRPGARAARLRAGRASRTSRCGTSATSRTPAPSASSCPTRRSPWTTCRRLATAAGARHGRPRRPHAREHRPHLRRAVLPAGPARARRPAGCSATTPTGSPSAPPSRRGTRARRCASCSSDEPAVGPRPRRDLRLRRTTPATRRDRRAAGRPGAVAGGGLALVLQRRRQGAPGAHAELLERVAQVRLDGLDRHEQRLGDLAVRPALAREPRDAALAGGAAPRRRAAAAGAAAPRSRAAPPRRARSGRRSAALAQVEPVAQRVRAPGRAGWPDAARRRGPPARWRGPAATGRPRACRPPRAASRSPPRRRRRARRPAGRRRSPGACPTRGRRRAGSRRAGAPRRARPGAPGSARPATPRAGAWCRRGGRARSAPGTRAGLPRPRRCGRRPGAARRGCATCSETTSGRGPPLRSRRSRPARRRRRARRAAAGRRRAAR